MWTAGVAVWVASTGYSPLPPLRFPFLTLPTDHHQLQWRCVSPLTEAEGDSPARQMEMKRLCCFIAAIRKNEALFRCFKQTCCLPTATYRPRLITPSLSLSLCFILSLSLPLYSPHLAVANLIYMYFYTFSSLLRARKLATGWAVASPPSSSFPTSRVCHLWNAAISFAVSGFRNICTPGLAVSSRFCRLSQLDIRLNPAVAPEMIAAFHFQLSRPAALAPAPLPLMNYLRFNSLFNGNQIGQKINFTKCFVYRMEYYLI